MTDASGVARGLTFAVLGPLEVSRVGRSVRLPSRKQRMLLACLLTAPGKLVSLDELATGLWGARPPPSAELTLRSLVSRLRTALAPVATLQSGGGVENLLRGHDGGYLLDVDSGGLDSTQFEQLLDEGRAALASGKAAAAVEALRVALGLWRGPAFAEIAHTPLAEVVAAGLERSRAEAVEVLAEAQLAVGQPAQALATLDPHLAAHPLRERGWGQRMLALYRLGRQAEALSVYQELRHRLREELGVEPSPSLCRLQRRVLLHDPDLDPMSAAAVSGPPVPVPARLTSPVLPIPLTPLVGRAGDLVELVQLLGQARLLTLTGVGGVGKTRLAIALAGGLSDNPEPDTAGGRDVGAGSGMGVAELCFPDGIRLVELASVTAPRMVISQAAASLGVPSADVSGLDLLRQRLVDFLADRRMLLVIDNCEQVIAPVAELVEALLTGCPQLRVVATSREPLALGGEQVFPVRPLSLPPPRASDPHDLAGSDAATLFCQRARAAHVGFGNSVENTAAITTICRRLDGIPLALELAAGKMRGLDAQQIADRLDDRFRLLTGGARTALPRQQTLSAAIDWSFGLLSDPERTLLCQLSVFPNTFDLAAAEATTHALIEHSEIAGAVSAGDIAGLVLGLVDKSMIDVQRSRGRVRYRLLETVRAYCAERLEQSGQTLPARRRHYGHYARLAAAQRANTPSTWDSVTWLAHSSLEEDNYRGAIGYALDQHDHDAALLLLSSFWPNWLYAGRLDDIEWFERALAGPATDTLARLEATVELAVLTTWWELAPWERSRQLLLQARQQADQLNDAGARWRSRYLYAEFLLTVQGEHADAIAEIHAALEVTTNPTQRGWCHHSLGWLAMNAGDPQAARGHFERASDLGHDSAVLIPHALAALGTLIALDGDSALAQALAARAVTAAQELPLPAVCVMALVRAAQTHLLCHDIANTVTTLDQLFELLHQLGNRRFHADAFEAAAILAAQTGEPARAACYFGVSARVRHDRGEEKAGAHVMHTLIQTSKRDVIDNLGERAYSEAESAGRSLTPTTALTDVRAALRRGPYRLEPSPKQS
jgi:predicted ATPase/DNA-binding SARP family transcriptional activator